jgi:hypothetical protein
MGTWGYGINSDDTVADILGDITDWLKAGETLESATHRAESEYAELKGDPDDEPLLWIGIAQAQWKYGSVEARILDQVRDDISSGRGLDRWEEDPRDLEKRKAVLAEFLAKIGSPNPKPSAMPKLVVRKPPFRVGDCLSVALQDGLFTAALVLKEDHSDVEHGSNLITGLDYLETTPPDIQVFTRAKWVVRTLRNVENPARSRLTGKVIMRRKRRMKWRDIDWYTAPVPRSDSKRIAVVGNIGAVRFRSPKTDSYTAWMNLGTDVVLLRKEKRKSKPLDGVPPQAASNRQTRRRVTQRPVMAGVMEPINMEREGLEYPLVPKSTSSLVPGQFWALPLSDGSYGCGRVVQLKPASMTGSRRLFLAGVLDWHSTELPTAETIARAACMDQGQAHVRSITETGGSLLGWRDLAADGIEPWLFRGAEGWRNSMVQEGLIPARPQTPEDIDLPVFSTWGLQVAQLIAERRFIERAAEG